MNLEFEVKEKSRLDRALRQEGSLSVQVAKRLIKEGRLSVNGHLVKKPAFEVRPGDQIQCQIEDDPSRSREFSPREKPALAIVFEDDCMVCVQKPSGILSVPATGSSEMSVRDRLQGQLSKIDPRVHLYAVHRLDRFASGALLFAKSLEARDRIMAQFKARRVRKTYVALVRRLAGERPLQATITLPVDDGREAVTDYEILAEQNGLAWVRAFPRTGRRHQIRIHLAQTVGPIVGDQTYGERVEFSVLRLMLHCFEMQLAHPMTSDQVILRAPLMQDFVSIATQIGAPPLNLAL